MIKKGGALQNEVKKVRALQNEGIIVINQGGAREKYSDKKTGATTTNKSNVPGDAGGGGSEQFDRRIIGFSNVTIGSLTGKNCQTH